MCCVDNLIFIVCIFINFCKEFYFVDLCLFNVRFVKNKILVIKDFVVENDIDMMVLIEIWFNFVDNDNDFFICDICLIGYKFIYILRVIIWGGGIGLLYKKFFKFKEML